MPKSLLSPSLRLGVPFPQMGPRPLGPLDSATAKCRPAIAALVFLALMVPLHALAGTWTAVNLPPNPPVFDLALLTDGSALVGVGSTTWYKLTPDSTGSYANGTWSKAANNNIWRQQSVSTTLKDGRYLLAGGEYTIGPNPATVEIYDTGTDTWIQGRNMPASIGDTATSILPDGRFYSSSNLVGTTYIYDPSLNTWVAGDPIGTGGTGFEKGWTLLQDGSILDGFNPGSRYSPSTGHWTATGAMPSELGYGEIGPMALLYSGQVVQFGTLPSSGAMIGHTAIYDPSSNTWTAGPDAPDGTKSHFGDTPSVVMTNGNVLCATTGERRSIWEYDPNAPLASRFSSVPHPGPGPDQFLGLFLQLPNGQVLYSPGTQLFLYTPTGTPQTSWRPTISSVSAPVAGEFTLNGTQLNGLTTGAFFGDEANSATNYPMVWVTDSGGHLFYARSYGFDQMAPRPAVAGSCKFTLPTALPNGAYQVHVSANGVGSGNTVPLNISGLHVTRVAGASVTKGATATWSVTLSGPGAQGGTRVNLLSSDSRVVTVPTSVVVPQGVLSATFNVTSRGFGIATITADTAVPHASFKPAAHVFGWAVSAVWAPVDPISAPFYALPGLDYTFTLYLSSPAPAGGVSVSLASDNLLAAKVLSATVLVSAGFDHAVFSVRILPGGGKATITASMINSSKSYSLLAPGPTWLNSILLL